MAELVAERFNYAVIIVLMMLGLYVAFASANLVKRLVGLAIFQTSVGLFYISMGKVAGGRPPILEAGEAAATAATRPAPAPAGVAVGIPAPAGMGPDGTLGAVYSNPLPHVLILTAIVVGVATLAVGLALVVRIREAYGTIEEAALHAMDTEALRAEARLPAGPGANAAAGGRVAHELPSAADRAIAHDRSGRSGTVGLAPRRGGPGWALFDRLGLLDGPHPNPPPLGEGVRLAPFDGTTRDAKCDSPAPLGEGVRLAPFDGAARESGQRPSPDSAKNSIGDSPASSGTARPGADAR